MFIAIQSHSVPSSSLNMAHSLHAKTRKKQVKVRAIDCYSQKPTKVGGKFLGSLCTWSLMSCLGPKIMYSLDYYLTFIYIMAVESSSKFY